MGVEPVGGGTMAGSEAHIALIDALHLLNNNVLHLVEFVGKDIKVEFVVHLQDHLGLDSLGLEAAVDAHHGELDDVGCGALDGSVDGIALTEAPHHGIPRVDVGQHATTAVEGGHIAFFACLGNGAVDVVTHLGEGRVIAVDKHLGFLARDIQALCQTKSADAVQDAEIGRFGLASLVTGDLFQGFVVDACSGDGVDVMVVGKGVKHRFVVAQVSDQSQLDLGVVRTEEHVAVGGNEGAADLLALVNTHGDILQVGIER